MVQTKIYPTSVIKTNTGLSYKTSEDQWTYMMKCVGVYLRSRGYEGCNVSLCIGDQWRADGDDVTKEENKVCFRIMKNRYKKPLERQRKINLSKKQLTFNNTFTILFKKATEISVEQKSFE